MFKKLHPDAKLPTRAKPGDAGLDIYTIDTINIPGMMQLYRNQMIEMYQSIKKQEYIPSIILDSMFDLRSCTWQFRTGIAMQLPDYDIDCDGHFFYIDDEEVMRPIPEVSVALAWDKSGIGNDCRKVFGGVIDYGYRGEILIRMINFGPTPWNVVSGHKICQLLIQSVIDIPDALLKWSDELSETERGDSGFNSTGP